MNIISVLRPKGGQGATVVSAILAVTAAGRGQRVLLVSDDGHAVLGVPEPLEATVPERVHTDGAGELYISTADDFAWDEWDLIVSDGVNRRRSGEAGQGDTVVMVVRNCYMALKRAITLVGKTKVDAFVCITEPGRALSKGDVAACLSTKSPVFELPYDPAIARAVDAGVLATRQPQGVTRFGFQVLDSRLPA